VLLALVTIRPQMHEAPSAFRASAPATLFSGQKFVSLRSPFGIAACVK
jgi:hypothetical protein